MYAPTAGIVERLDHGLSPSVIDWSCPVPFFGHLPTARIATVGINPSSREFIDDGGSELCGEDQRLPTLGSLGLDRWSDAHSLHLRTIIDSCQDYFAGNPYDRWFRVLDRVISATEQSYYGPLRTACHVDLVPYATRPKWGDLSLHERRALLGWSRDALGSFLRESPVELLVLNGRSVVRDFEDIADVRLSARHRSGWSLPRTRGSQVDGFSYEGVVACVGGVDLPRPVAVIGYNHNLQSSFGVTSDVAGRIRDWIGQVWREVDG